MKPAANQTKKRRVSPKTITGLRGISPMTAPRYLGSSAQCVSIGTSNYSEKLARAGEEYVSLVVQDAGGHWYFVRITPDGLDTAHAPVVYPKHLADEIFEIWKRAVMDRAIPWDSNVIADTLRIIQYRSEAEDITLSLSGDYDAAKELMRLTAMSKLSDDEARLLGLTHLKAKQKLLNNPVFHKDDAVQLKSLSSETCYMNTDALMFPFMDN